MEKWIKKIMQFGGLFLFMSCNQPVDVVTIDLSREEAEIPPSLYGIFFEEITHSGDGGLYAEMIRNRGFEDGTLPSGTVLKMERQLPNLCIAIPMIPLTILVSLGTIRFLWKAGK